MSRLAVTLCSILMNAWFAFSSPVFASEKVLNAVPQPPGTTREIIAIDLVQNGHRLSVGVMHGIRAIEPIIDFYRQAWNDPIEPGAPGYLEDESGEWVIISRLEKDWNHVVQLRRHEGEIQSRISVMSRELVSSGPANIAMPPAAVLVSSTLADDALQDASTFVVLSSSSESQVSNFYRRHYRGEGWGAVTDQNVGGSHVLVLKRLGESTEIVVSRTDNGETLAIINRVQERE